MRGRANHGIDFRITQRPFLRPPSRAIMPFAWRSARSYIIVRWLTLPFCAIFCAIFWDVIVQSSAIIHSISTCLSDSSFMQSFMQSFVSFIMPSFMPFVSVSAMLVDTRVSVSAMLVDTRQKNIAQVFILERYFFVSICPAAIPCTCLSVFLAAVLLLCW